MKKNILVLVLVFISSFGVFAQKVRTTAVFDADTSTRPKVGFYGIGVRGNVPFLVKNTGNTLRFGMVSGFTTNYLPKFNSSGSFLNSQIFDNGNNVGIGTTSASAKFQINGTSDSQEFIRLAYGADPSNYHIKIRQSVLSGGVVGWHLDLKNNGSDYNNTLTFDRGNVGIGTTSTDYKLVVKDDIYAGIGLYSGFNFADNRNWAIRTNVFGSGSWGGIAFMQSPTKDATPSVTRMGIDINGNVGIGTASPSRKLHVNSSDYIGSFFQSPFNIGDLYYSSILVGYAIDNNKSSQFGFVHNNANPSASFAHITPFGLSEGQAIAVTSGGNVGIGTTAPTSKLQVVGLPVYADNAAATSGGLTEGAFYRTSTGVLMVVY